MNFQIRDRFVSATQLTLEIVEAHLFDGVALPEGFGLGAASHHPENRTISYFYGRAYEIPRNFHSTGPRIEIGEWRVEFSDGRLEVLSHEEFLKRFEEVAA
jgi:hypothetical protein